MNIWYLVDGKPGHLNQLLGLLSALEKKIQIDAHEIAIQDVKANFFNWLLSQVSLPLGIGSPDLIIGAGHRTHWPLLALSKKTTAKSLLLMRPSLPLRFFDFICAPLHDQLPEKENFLSTNGAINQIEPSEKIINTGMILIGGLSTHAKWDTDSILEQLYELLNETPNIHWVLTTSRRTPENFIKKIIAQRNLEIVPWQQSEKNWLPEKIATVEQVWVTPDSISMLYEALTAGAKVGVFQLKTIPTRVSIAIQKLIKNNRISEFSVWKMDKKWNIKNTHLNEAERCANWLLKQMNIKT